MEASKKYYLNVLWGETAILKTLKSMAATPKTVKVV